MGSWTGAPGASIGLSPAETLATKAAVSGGGNLPNIAGQLPNLMAAIRTTDDASPPTLRVIGLGSSIGVGATLPDPATQAPVVQFVSRLTAALAQRGRITFATTNGSVNGSTISGGNSTDYAAAKTTAGGNPTVVLLIYGMNDGMQGQYHSGQTYPGCYTALSTMVDTIRGDGGDPIIVTTPHPYSTRTPWADYTGPISYPPGGVQIPAATYAESVVIADWLGNSKSVPASYRHLRINEAMRQVAWDKGVALIDAERFWFDALANYGEDALFNAAEYAHPNLLGHEQGYWLAFDAFCGSLRAGMGSATAPVKFPEVTAYKVNNATFTTTGYVSDSQLQFYVGSNQIWTFEADIHYTVPTANDMHIAFSIPSGSGGRFGLTAPAFDATTFDTGPAISRSTTLSGGNLRCGGNGADGSARVNGLIATGSTAGNVTMQFGLDTGSGTLTVYQYSNIRARRVA